MRDFAAFRGDFLQMKNNIQAKSGVMVPNYSKCNQTSFMVESFTLNQCVRLMYGETTPEESNMLTEIISGNDRLRAEFEDMQKGFRALGTTLLSPKAEVTKAILKYSRDTALHLSC